MKEELKNFALKVKQETGKFPILRNWRVSDGYPCGYNTLIKLFGSYNDFKKFCEEPIKMRTGPLTIEYIKENCIIDDNGCWNWSKKITEEGYGLTYENGNNVFAHRKVYELTYGPIEIGLIVRHKVCDNRRCCNPGHLSLGTRNDNAKDRIGKHKDLNRNDSLISKSKKFKTLEDKLSFYIQNSVYTDNGCLVSLVLTPLPSDYYQITYKYKKYLLHRLVLAIKLHKKYEDILQSQHICNNRRCYNKNHLKEGNSCENVLDSRDYNAQIKIVKSQVLEIKKDLPNWDFTVIGNKTKFDLHWSSAYNVSKGIVQKIRTGETWNDI